MNRRRLLFIAAFVQFAACATTRPPVAPVTCGAEKTAEAKAGPAEAATEGKDGTALNERRRLYVTCFNFLRKRVAEHWKPGEEYLQHDPDGPLRKGQNPYMLLHVYLSADGSLDHVAIDRSAGLDILDKLAVEAFERAQPFAESPCNLLRATGLSEFQVGFFFVGAQPSLKVYVHAPSP